MKIGFGVLVSLLLGGPAFAGEPPSQHKKKQATLCEYSLDPKTARSALTLLDKQILNYPFHLTKISSAPTAAAWQKLGIDPASDEPALNRWLATLSIDNESLYPVRFNVTEISAEGFRRNILPGFPDSSPTVWQNLSLSPEDRALPLEIFAQKYPLEAVDFDEPLMTIGFHSDVDADGVRRIIGVENGENLVYGLDVPCDKLSLFSSPTSRVPVLTSGGAFCRILAAEFFHRKVQRRSSL